ncbi:MAG: SGNH/GDSL hydrolase family protein, partial [Clostridia bacterium]|nr:SGNH/GDSL hydrolase family protein [Clostridia bacterium]
GQAPNQPSYAMLFTQALADLFDYTIRYRGSGTGTCRVPTSNYVAGTRGTITYVNSAVGGWTSQQGVENVMNYILTKVRLYGCDLLVLAFGMNDGVYAPTTTRDNNKKIIDAVLERAPEASVLMVSTMVPNPDATNGWYGTQPQQEQYLISLAKTYRDKGVACEVARMTAVSLDVLKHKEFKDYTGNNINHPNDFFSRVYAQVLLQALIGYENMN